MVLPMTSSVNIEAQATAVTQPCALKRTAAIVPFSTRAARRRTSPHTGFDTSTEALASERSPALRGFLKWSRTAAEYMAESLPLKSKTRKRSASNSPARTLRGEGHAKAWPGRLRVRLAPHLLIDLPPLKCHYAPNQATQPECPTI